MSKPCPKSFASDIGKNLLPREALEPFRPFWQTPRQPRSHHHFHIEHQRDQRWKQRGWSGRDNDDASVFVKCFPRARSPTPPTSRREKSQRCNQKGRSLSSSHHVLGANYCGEIDGILLTRIDARALFRQANNLGVGRFYKMFHLQYYGSHESNFQYLLRQKKLKAKRTLSMYLQYAQLSYKSRVGNPVFS